jgi:hypothetical protein
VYSGWLGVIYGYTATNRSVAGGGGPSQAVLPASHWSPGGHQLHSFALFIAIQIRVKCHSCFVNKPLNAVVNIKFNAKFYFHQIIPHNIFFLTEQYRLFSNYSASLQMDICYSNYT